MDKDVLTENDIHAVIKPMLDPIVKAQEGVDVKLGELTSTINRIILIEERQLSQKEHYESLSDRYSTLQKETIALYKEGQERHGALQGRVDRLEPQVIAAAGWVNKAILALLAFGFAASAYAVAVINHIG